MTICLFGIYDPGYARTRVIREGLERNGHRIVECRADPLRNPGISKYVALYRRFRELRGERIDKVIVCFPGQAVMLFAWMLFGRGIIFDAFLSLYDSGVWDRRVYGARSVRALYSWVLDWMGCALASHVVLDTNEHIRYFHETFGVPLSKCVRLWISADDVAFRPRETPLDEMYTVHFHGTFIPLQGVPYIVRAAELLRGKGIRFRLVGGGQESARVREMIERSGLGDMIDVVGKVPVADIPAYIARAHITLGIFGDTNKTQRVIPNKVFEQLAMGKPIITADTPAVRELLVDRVHALLVPTADPEALAAAILELKESASLSEKLGRNARVLFETVLRPETIVKNMLIAVS